MAVKLTVTPGQLRAKKAELEGLNNELSKEFTNLGSEHDALQSMWEGTAKSTFDKEFNADMQKMNSFVKGIQDYCRTLEEIIKTYENAETANTSTANTRTAN